MLIRYLAHNAHSTREQLVASAEGALYWRLLYSERKAKH
ncbi:hypothetical protein SAMN06297280_0550 [Arsukibacterium tuosuense]|uniref:Uncharacterized protein n=1 Tax=Arsukibacterium tuosuense TaxID=1323745 RepID=A0A285I5J3_9GAMM|nr:hypothetical protein SAMN06297280_0550 [Arsukibacterium tuosuense]